MAALVAGLALPSVALAQTTPNVSVFAPAAATATAQAQQAQAATTPAAAGDCPTGNVCVQFGAFAYALDPQCSDQHYLVGLRSEQDPATGDDVSYIKTLNFIMASDNDWIIIPAPEHKATGPDAGKPLGARLCAGVEGAQ